MTALLRAVCPAVLLSGITGTAAAQLIPIRTVPIARADQFEVFPSLTQGMGGVSLGLADTLRDVAANPATGARLTGARFLAFPIVYSVSENAGGGRALPVGAVAAAGSWFGGFSIALQMVDAGRPTPSQFLVGLAERGDAVRLSVAPLDTAESHGNAYAFGLLGRRWPTGLAVGASVSFARRKAMDGVDLLYAGSQAVEQFGHTSDIRVGVLKEWPGSESFEAVALYSRSRMSHDVIFLDPFWDPGTQQTFLRARSEHNRDHAHSWGLHLEYERPLGGNGWRIGWLATANRVFHRAVPPYELNGEGVLTVPWDPGDAHAYNVGIGVARTHGSGRFGVDVIYEPIWSNTWETAEAETATRLGGTIPVGGKTLENDFRFANTLFRMGVGDEVVLAPETAVGLQLGLAVRWMHYWLAQYDNVQMAGRNDEEEWVEWTPTWGLSMRFPSWVVRYQGRAMQGTRRPGVAPFRGGVITPALDVAPGFGWPPGGLDVFGPVSVVTHQVSVSVPLGPIIKGGTP
jgi:hypothetical protein